VQGGLHVLAEVLASCGVAVAFGAEEFGDFALLVETGTGFAVFEFSLVVLLHFLFLEIGEFFLAKIFIVLEDQALLFRLFAHFLLYFFILLAN
jgi:hypothetical protein